MRLIRRKMIGPLALAFTAAAFASFATPSSQLQAALLPDAATTQREVRRIHAHFDSVLRELSSVDVSQRTKTQLAERQLLIKTLRGYNERGVFPHNYDFAAPTPYFIDRKTGTLCAVAFLLESTGRRDIVDRVARANNNVWVADLKRDTAMASWLDERGITLNEAARIQVPYNGDDRGFVGDLQSGNDSFMYVAAGASLASLATSVGMTAYNLIGNSNGHGQKRAVLGLVSGLTTSVISGVLMYQGESESRDRLTGTVGVAIGAAGMAVATRSLMHRSTYLAAKRDDEESVKRTNVETNISPILPIGKNAGTGLAMSIRF